MSVVVNDANYNVMGMVELGYALHVHKQSHPYGRPLWLFDEGNHIVGDPEYGPLLDDSGFFEDPNERHIENHDTPHRMTHGFAGGMLDPETYFLWLRNRPYHVKLGRMGSPDPNGTALILTTTLGQMGQGPMVNAHVSPMAQYADGLSPYQYVRSNPNTGQDPTGMFSYLEVVSTTAIQAVMGGMINGVISKIAGRDFWEGFSEGAIGGAVGGSVGYAFQAARAGFFATAVLGRFVEGAVEEGVTSFYNGDDVKDALVNALYGGGMNLATGGLLSGGSSRGIESIRTLRAVNPGIALKKNADQFVDLTSPRARKHILDGDGPGRGGHRWRAVAEPGKSYFPKDWTDDKIMHYVSDVLTDPLSRAVPSPKWPGRYEIRGQREGINILVVWEPNGKGVVTAHPEY